jgi:hypothetical protein
MRLTDRKFRFVIVGAFGASLVAGLAVAAFSSGMSSKEVGAPAAPGQPTYLLSDFQLQYPYIDVTSNHLGDEEDPSRVGVRFRSEWAGGEYPGVAVCEIQALNEDGNIVGSVVADVESLVPSAAPAGWTPIAVSEEPTSFASTCEAGRRAPLDAGYTFSNATVESDEGSIRLVADIGWQTNDAPGTQACTATLATDGVQHSVDFTLDAPPERLPVVLLPTSMKGAVVRQIECVPFS